MKKHLVVIYLLFVSCALKAQTVVSGTVFNAQTNEALPGATLFAINNIQNAVITDVDGKYSITVSENTTHLICTFIGMANDTLVISTNRQSQTRNVYLFPVQKDLQTTVITASRREQKIEESIASMEVLKPNIIEGKNTTSIESALEQVPGLNILDSEPQIRGGSGFSFGVGSRVATLIDGLPIMTGDAGKTEWSFIPIENIEQIEVVKGASSVLYGSSALSGTINFLTAFPKEKTRTYMRTYCGAYSAPSRDSAKWWNGTASFYGINALHAQRLGTNDVAVGISALYDHNFIGPHIPNPALPFKVDTVTEDDVADKSYRFDFNYRHRFAKIKGLAAGINGNFMQSHTNFSLVWGDSSSNIYRAFPGTMTLTKFTTFYIDPYITYYSPSGLKHNLHARYFYTDNKNSNGQSNKSTLYMADYQLLKEFESEGLTLTTGIFTNQVHSSAELFSQSGTPNNKLENWAVYTQLDKTYEKTLTITAGFRGEYFSINKIETVIRPIFRAGLNLKIARGTFLRYSYGQGYRYPTIAEKFIKTSAGGITVFPNQQLKPETSWNSEIGIKQGIKFGNFLAFVDAAGFWQEYKNTIEYIYALWRPDSAGFKFVNTGPTRVRGLDFSLAGQGNLSRNISVTVLAGYTYILPQSIDPAYVFAVDSPADGFEPTELAYLNTSTDTTDNILKYRIQHQAKADIEISWKKKISVGASWRYYSFMRNIDKTFYDLDNPGVLPTGIKTYREKNNQGARIFDFRISYSAFRFLKASIIINNAFNTEYTLRPLKIESPRTYAVQLVADF